MKNKSRWQPMTQKEFDKLDKQEQIEMLKEVEGQFNVDQIGRAHV